MCIKCLYLVSFYREGLATVMNKVHILVVLFFIFGGYSLAQITNSTYVINYRQCIYMQRYACFIVTLMLIQVSYIFMYMLLGIDSLQNPASLQ